MKDFRHRFILAWCMNVYFLLILGKKMNFIQNSVLVFT